MFSLVKRTPAGRLLNPFDMFDKELSNFYFGGEEKTVTPRCQVKEESDKYSISLDIPGVDKNDIKLEVKNNILSISAERKDDRSDSDVNEVYYNKYVRSFSLGEQVDEDKISAEYNNGVLKISIAKKAEKASKTISIQ